jgi:hypothetical protein
VRRWERYTFNVLALVVAATGFVYFWMKYALESTDPFAVVNHPLQAVMLNLHVVASPAFVLMFGVVLNSHVMKKLRATKMPNRRSGYTSLVTFAAMVLSGYLLQIAVEPVWLQLLVAVHVVTGTVFAVVYGTHLLISVKLARRQALAREVA